MSFSDIMKNLRAGFMGSLDGRNGALGFTADAIYMTVHQSRPAARPAFGDVDGKMNQQAYALAATWRIRDGAHAVDLLAGARTNYVKADLDLSASALAPQGRSVVKHRDWVDGYVGARARHAVDERWTLTGYADIGKGGADLTWQLMAGAEYAFSKDVSAKLGYRYFKVEYDKGDFLYNMASAGGYLGVGMRF
jgi:opacity protein-like surface antigen